MELKRTVQQTKHNKKLLYLRQVNTVTPKLGVVCGLPLAKSSIHAMRVINYLNHCRAQLLMMIQQLPTIGR